MGRSESLWQPPQHREVCSLSVDHREEMCPRYSSHVCNARGPQLVVLADLGSHIS